MRIMGVLLLTALAGCSVDANTGPGEFVCETGGALSERHVGVKSARVASTTGMAWRIEYADGDGAYRYYLQQTGETCALERLP